MLETLRAPKDMVIAPHHLAANAAMVQLPVFKAQSNSNDKEYANGYYS